MDTQVADRIGVLSMPLTVVGEGKVNTDPTPAKLEFANGSSAEFTPPPLDPPVATEAAEGDPDPERLTWPKYLAWRKTKTPDRGCNTADRIANIQNNFYTPAEIAIALEEVDQSTHELVGEVAELSELLGDKGLDSLFAFRGKTIDECGDILFCASWAMEAWGDNPLLKFKEGLNLTESQPGSEKASIAAAITSCAGVDDMGRFGGLQDAVTMEIMRVMLDMQTNAGLLCNSFKKLRWQNRIQNPNTQQLRICEVLTDVCHFLTLIGSSVEEALTVNMKKLEARYPSGVSLSSGGIRTGEGK